MSQSHVICPRCKYKIKTDNKFQAEIKGDYPNAFKPWKPEHDMRLGELFALGTPILSICKELGRQPSAIKRRVELLGLEVRSVQVPDKSPEEVWIEKEQADLNAVRSHGTRTDVSPSATPAA